MMMIGRMIDCMWDLGLRASATGLTNLNANAMFQSFPHRQPKAKVKQSTVVFRFVRKLSECGFMYVATVWYRLNHGATADLTVRKSLTVALTKDPNLTLRNSGVGAATYGIQEDMPQSSNPICFKE